MLDMVDYKAIHYAAVKSQERKMLIKTMTLLLEKKAVQGGFMPIFIDGVVVLAQNREEEYFRALVHFVTAKRCQHLAAAKRLNIKGGFTDGVKAAHYYRGLFHATEGRQMLDKLDAEDTQASKRMEAEHA